MEKWYNRKQFLLYFFCAEKLKKSKVILLDSIRSMQNVGAIFRNADGSGFEKLYLTGFTPHPPRSDISKTALWAEQTTDWEYSKDAISCIEELKSQWYQIYAVELTETAVDYKELFTDKSEKVCLIMGNEVSGVSDEVLSMVDKTVIIPMLGQKESLNVSVAAGIVMYALV